jgi:predicted O-methyltransferase YrrM
MVNPDFNRDRFEGQLNPDERECLYRNVLAAKPKSVWEVGTCRGGGTTYYISCALHNIDEGGLLTTVENNREFLDYAMALYTVGALKDLFHHIIFNFGTSLQVYPAMLADSKIPTPDFVVLDGGERSIECVYEYAMFRPYMKLGGRICFHDWDTGKTDYIRDLITNDQDWKLLDSARAFRVFEKVGTVHDAIGIRI